MLIIILVTLVTYFVLIAWTWQSLYDVEKNKKVLFIILGITIVYLITLIIFNISESGIYYQNEQTKKIVRRVLTALFTGLNGIVFIPQVAKIYIASKEKQSKKENKKKKTKTNTKIVILMIVFCICVLFECGYLKDIQKGIIASYNSASQQ